jgi:hypothetical protein
MKLWTVIKTEDVKTQCTGFSTFDTLVVVFEKKPDVQTLAPFLEGLCEDIGQAISEVSTLLNSGYLDLNQYRYELNYIETGQKIDN